MDGQECPSYRPISNLSVNKAAPLISSAWTMAKIYISYRRPEGSFQAALIRKKLASHFAGTQIDIEILIDVTLIHEGGKAREQINASIGACDCLLAVIGKSWVSVCDDDGNWCLDQRDDLVRIELEAGLSRGTKVIPVLVDDTPMPSAEQLPASLHRLAKCKPMSWRQPPDLDSDLDTLARFVEAYVSKRTASAIQEHPRDRGGATSDRPRRSSPRSDDYDAEDEDGPSVRKPAISIWKIAFVVVLCVAVTGTVIVCCTSGWWFFTEFNPGG
jgi:hypothetical protein